MMFHFIGHRERRCSHREGTPARTGDSSAAPTLAGLAADPSLTARRSVKWCDHSGKQPGGFLLNQMPYDPAFTPEKRRYLNVNVYSGFVRNNPNREQCRHPSVAEQSVTQAVVHPYSGLLASYKRNGLSLPTSPLMNG